MRRNSTHHHPLIPYLLFIAAILYESLASMTLFMSPLLGVGFYYIIHYVYDERRYTHFILIFMYALYVEFNRGLIPLSFLFFTLIFYKLFFGSIKRHMHCQVCLVFSYITIGYLGYYVFNLFLAYLFNMDLPYFGISYLTFIVSDIFLTLVLI